jgi:hypothetical protein
MIWFVLTGKNGLLPTVFASRAHWKLHSVEPGWMIFLLTILEKHLLPAY